MKDMYLIAILLSAIYGSMLSRTGIHGIIFNTTNRQCLNIADITATNPLTKGYCSKWYQLKENECSVSSDYKDRILLNDVLVIQGIGKFTVKSYMSSIDKKTGTPIKKTIDIFKPSISECMKFGRKRARVFLEYK